MKKLLMTVLVVTLSCNVCVASQNFNANVNEQTPYQLETNTLKNSVVTVPAGLTFKAVFLSPINSVNANTGQEVSLALVSDFYYNNKKVAPVGSSVIGTVIEVSKARHGSINGRLTLRFTHIITPSGLDIPISAVIHTTDGTGVVIGGDNFMFTGGEEGSVFVSSGVKSYVPAFSGVHAGGGAAMTTAVETGGGSLLKSIWDKGEDVDISSNTTVELILTQPITVTPSNTQNE